MVDEIIPETPPEPEPVAPEPAPAPISAPDEIDLLVGDWFLETVWNKGFDAATHNHLARQTEVLKGRIRALVAGKDG